MDIPKRFAGLKLKKKDRAELGAKKSKGKPMSARTWRRVRVLERLDEACRCERWRRRWARFRVSAEVCGPAPDGRARWTVRLVAEQAVRRGITTKVGRETIRIVLATHDLKPWREKKRCAPRLDLEFVERMEDVLRLYARRLDPRQPVICLDETPILLHGSKREGRSMRPGQVARRDYEYRRSGPPTCTASSSR